MYTVMEVWSPVSIFLSWPSDRTESIARTERWGQQVEYWHSLPGTDCHSVSEDGAASSTGKEGSTFVLDFVLKDLPPTLLLPLVVPAPPNVHLKDTSFQLMLALLCCNNTSNKLFTKNVWIHISISDIMFTILGTITIYCSQRPRNLDMETVKEQCSMLRPENRR